MYLRLRFSLHRNENDNISLRPLKCRYHSDMEFSVRCQGCQDTIKTALAIQSFFFRYCTLTWEQFRKTWNEHASRSEPDGKYYGCNWIEPANENDATSTIDYIPASERVGWIVACRAVLRRGRIRFPSCFLVAKCFESFRDSGPKGTS